MSCVSVSDEDAWTIKKRYTHIEPGLQLLEDPSIRLEARVLDLDVVVVLQDALVEVEEDVGRGLGEPDADLGVHDGGRADGRLHGCVEVGLLLRGSGMIHSGVRRDREVNTRRNEGCASIWTAVVRRRTM